MLLVLLVLLVVATVVLEGVVVTVTVTGASSDTESDSVVGEPQATSNTTPATGIIFMPEIIFMPGTVSSRR